MDKNQVAHLADGSYMKETAKIEKHDLIILDDFGLQAIDRDKQHILLDIIEDRHHKRSTIIASQVPVSVWYELTDDKTIADAILDRLVHTAHSTVETNSWIHLLKARKIIDKNRKIITTKTKVEKVKTYKM